jgi:hydroxymethylpyrimidine/phosphomethylpyrimidine kinase
VRAERRAMPCALSIGGLDAGAGAGVLADLRAFAAAGAFGCAVVAVSTVQSTRAMRSAQPLPPGGFVEQAVEVLRNQRVRAVKVGALGSARNVRAVAALLAHTKRAHLAVVIDTPMLATRGRGRLLAPGAVAALRDELLPHATLVTVNAHEAQVLGAGAVRTVGEAQNAARALVGAGARAALIKGGHLEGAAVDVLALRGGAREVIELRARRLPGPDVHGTGCTLASLIAGRLARRPHAHVDRDVLVAAVRWAKRVHHAALARAVDVGGGSRVLVF